MNENTADIKTRHDDRPVASSRNTALPTATPRGSVRRNSRYVKFVKHRLGSPRARSTVECDLLTGARSARTTVIRVLSSSVDAREEQSLWPVPEGVHATWTIDERERERLRCTVSVLFCS